MLRFAGFELDKHGVELRRTGGAAIALRPKTFDLLGLLAARPRQVIGKEELMAAIWPNVHVGEDSLFQCIRELRLALGDEQRELIRVVPGRGYRLDAEVDDTDRRASAPPDTSATSALAPVATPRPRFTRFGLAAAAALGIVVAITALTTPLVARAVFPPTPTLAILPLAATGTPAGAMAANLTERLIDGFEKIPNLVVTAPSSASAGSDYTMAGMVEDNGGTWTAQARLTRSSTNEVVWAGSFTIDSAKAPALELQQSRLAAALGHDLSLRLNTLLNESAMPSSPDADAGKVVVQQATAYINQQTSERFHAAQSMLEDALVRDPDNIDIQVALAAQLMRGVQMLFYSPDENKAARGRARDILESALETAPNSIPVHEALCRFLTTTNQFKDALVACARTLTFDPWNGIALYHLGLAELNLGRFDDALATFLLADSFDTPEVSRWTWKIGIGWTYMLMERPADALPWLERTIEITAASGRVYLLAAAAYQALGRTDEAAAAMQKVLEIRPGSNVVNIGVPMENTSPIFAAATDRLLKLGIAAGLPPA